MVHDSGAAAGRMVRMRRRFPAADLVVFGHSHIPRDESTPGLRIFSPGSPTDRRRQPHGTLGVLHIDAGRLTEATIVPVTSPNARSPGRSFYSFGCYSGSLQVCIQGRCWCAGCGAGVGAGVGGQGGDDAGGGVVMVAQMVTWPSLAGKGTGCRRRRKGFADRARGLG